MKDMMLMENFPDPGFPYRVAWLFPDELYKEEIFKNNLSHILSDLEEFINETKLLENNKRILEYMKFDSQKEKQLVIVNENRKRISEIEDKMNEGISPYKWRVIKNFSGFLCNRHVHVDYLLELYKRNYEINF